MLSFLHRPGRWLRRTRWMAGRIACDVGLRGATQGGAAWLRGNPFFGKTLRIESRRPFFFLRLLLTVLTMSALLVGGLLLEAKYREAFQWFAERSSVHIPTLLFMLLSFAHVLFVLGTRAAMATALPVEERRQTLSGLLMTPLQRAEIPLAMAVAPALGALLVGLTGLPLYILLYQTGVVEWRDIGLLYLLLALLSFAPPVYTLPALSGAAATPDAPQLMTTARRVQERQKGRGSVAGFFSVLWSFFLLMMVARWIFSLGGDWSSHLLAALPPAITDFSLLFFFAWPYTITQILGTPLAFYSASITPLWYLLPLIMATWLASALRTGAALTAGSVEEMQRMPLYRRSVALSRGVGRLGLACFIGFAWRAWVLSGDTGSLAGDLSGDVAWGVAGLLLILGSVAVPAAAYRALEVKRLRGKTGTLRPPRRLLRRTLRLAWRPLRVALLLFAGACLLGRVSPFVPPVCHILGQLALTALCSVTFLGGFGVWWAATFTARAKSRKWARPAEGWAAVALLVLLYIMPFLALSLPIPAAWNVAALSPFAAWLRLFPGSDALIHKFPYWPLGALPSFNLSIAVPTLAGLLLGVRAYAPGSRAARPVPASAISAASSVAIATRTPAKHASRTEALLGWMTARTDNPLFTHEIRARTRSGLWFTWLLRAPAIFVAVLAVAKLYPAFVNGLSFMAILDFFRHDLFYGRLPPTQPFADLAALLLTWQVYLLALRGQTIGENLIATDRQRGTLGFILLTPLTTRQIFWGKLWGQTAGTAAIWLVLSLFSLALYLLAAPGVGLAPALTAWLVGEIFVFCLFLLGVSLGAALATHTTLLKTLRGISTLLLFGAIAAGAWLVFHFLPADPFFFYSRHDADAWLTLAGRLALGSLFALALCLPAFGYAVWRFTLLRRRDIPFGDSVPD